jgi:MYXO-CTERM domain-containing protein
VGLPGVVVAAEGARAGLSAVLSASDGTDLTQPAQAWVSAGALSLSMGGCGCTGSRAGEALAWAGLAGLLWRRRRNPL